MTETPSSTPPSGHLPAPDSKTNGSQPSGSELLQKRAADGEAAAALWGAQEPLHAAHEGFELARQELVERDKDGPIKHRSPFLSVRAMVLLVVVGTLVGCGEHMGHGLCEWLKALWDTLFR